MKNQKSIFYLLFILLMSNNYVNAQDYYFYGYTDTVWTTVTNWDNFNGYPGTTIAAGKYARIPSNFSLGRCSLDVDVINNGRMLLQSKFYLNGHSLTNNGRMEFTGTVWGDIVTTALGNMSPGWEPWFPVDNISLSGGDLTSHGLLQMDFRGTDNTFDYFYGVTTANLGGELEIRFRDNFTPVFNQNYKIIDANSIVGTFSTVTWPAGTIGSITYSGGDVNVIFTVLPIELIDFTSQKDGDDVILSWSTASETNNSHFNVEHSVDGKSFNKIGEIEGSGNSTEERNYSFIHDSRNSLNFYRLEQVDFDGSTEYSKVISLDFNADESRQFLRLAPNPVSTHLNLYNLTKEPLFTTVFDLNGNKLAQAKFEKEGHIELPVEQLPQGIYLLKIHKGNQIEFQRFIKN